MMIVPRFFKRWDIDPSVAESMSFSDSMVVLNLRRLELACLLLIINDVIALAMGYHLSSIVAELMLAVLFPLLMRWIRPHISLRAKRMAVWIAVALVLLTTQWSIAQLAANGYISSGYLVRLLTITLLFVIPAKELAIILALGVITYGAMIMSLPVSGLDQVRAIIGGIIGSVISQVAGMLIYSTRRNDHEQKQLIKSQNARLLAQNIELDQLMAITAHDLRSPLHGLRNVFDLASRKAVNDPGLPLRVMQDGIGSLDAMLRLVTRVLESHQAEHAPLIKMVHEDVREHVRDAVGRAALMAEATGVAVGLDMPDKALSARFDEGALSHILDNLLSNAVRFSPPDSTVRVAVSAADGCTLITVEDSGPGIDPARQASMFRKFRHGVATCKEGKTTSGMGLFIAATYAERMGATLSYRPANTASSIFQLALIGDAANIKVP